VASRSSSSSSGRSERKAKAAAAAAELSPELLPAFEALRAWRAGQAKEQGVPAYVIFHDATLREIATVWPASVAELGGISGIGEKKLVTYGEGVIGVLASLERPSGSSSGSSSGSGSGSGLGSGSGQAESSGSGEGSAPARRSDGDPGLYWPEMEAEPEPEDWV
jgi:ATP-dependent DNA helicase RecQ